jgi:acyl-CoA synthetase (AMP-forming)/AMP-acid ligase II
MRGRENIYLREIAAFSYWMGGIANVQVASVPRENCGEEVGVIIVLAETLLLNQI